ncbi:WD40 repeat domain-containing protein [Pseudoalteromonas 'SMAR']|uniref:WD40 repeat domain-containing protein n=1 Tax=Pseudoalteromonas 'SMAR' TaxID=3416908 RepID=UPI003AF2734A
MWRQICLLLLVSVLAACADQPEISRGVTKQLDTDGIVLGHFSKDGQWSVILDSHSQVKIFDNHANRPVFAVPKDKVKTPVTALLLSNDKNMLVIAGENLVSIWSISKQKLITNIPFAGVSPLASISALALSDDNQRLLVGMDDGSLNMADLFTKLNNRFMPHQRPIQHLAFLPGAERFISGGQDGKVAMWQFASPDALFERQFDHRITSLTISDDGHQLFISDGLNAQHVMDLEQQQQVSELHYMARFKMFRQAKFIPGSNLLATSSSKSHLSIWRYNDGEELGTWSIQAKRKGATVVDMYSPDANTLVTLNSDGILETWALNQLAQK